MASPQIVAVYGGKGGIGKTTTAANLAWLFGSDGHRTLAVDANVPQQSLQVIYERLQADPPYDLTIEERPELLGNVKHVDYDRVVIDCPPSPREAAAALKAATRIVVPYVPKYLETRAIMQTVHDWLPGRPFRVLFVGVAHSMTKRARDAAESMAGFNVPIYRTVIRQYVAHERSQAHGLPVFTDQGAALDVNGPHAAGDYVSFYKELLAEL